jgi:hypothetical protein
MSEAEVNPKYLRFLRSLVVGTALAALPLSTACSDDEDCPGDSCMPTDPDAMADAGVPVVVDGPLPPPDLPKVA